MLVCRVCILFCQNGSKLCTYVAFKCLFAMHIC
uniref:Uncharacterized protein n=1 Tax=Arundo donax TaxID=35708 RepID=A0A0A8ZFX0_ARUDO